MLKIIGIPQNRERVYIISIRNDIAQSEFCFPQKVPLMWKLKDFLEDEVEEKYYLSEKAIGKLIKKSNKLIKNTQHQTRNIYNTNNISQTLSTMSNSKNKNPFILIKEGTRCGYAKAEVGDSINISYTSNITKRGRVGKEISHTILATSNMATLENINKPICINNKNNKLSIQDRVYDPEGISTTVVASNYRTKIAEKIMFNLYNNKKIVDIAPTQTTSCGNTTSSATVLISENGTHYMKIRKLTPLECWRLMRI